MRELTRSNDPVWLSWLTSLLADAGIPSHLLDTHMSLLEGSIAAIPRRVMVADEDFDEARGLMEAGKDAVS